MSITISDNYFDDPNDCLVPFSCIAFIMPECVILKTTTNGNNDYVRTSAKDVIKIRERFAVWMDNNGN